MKTDWGGRVEGAVKRRREQRKEEVGRWRDRERVEGREGGAGAKG